MKEEVELWQHTKRPILITSRCSADVCLLITWRSLTMTSCSHVGKAYLTFSSCWRSNPYWLSHFFPTNQPTIKTLRRVTTPWNMTTRLLCLTTVSDLPLLIYKFILDRFLATTCRDTDTVDQALLCASDGHLNCQNPELQLIFIYFYCSSAVVFIFACFPCFTAPSDLRVFSSISNGLVAHTLSSLSISSAFAVTLLTLC